jgi:alpha-galactosidase
LKWDHNRDLTTAGTGTGTAAAQAGYRAQIHALHALLARIRASHPLVEIESCSGGGGRIDFAVLRQCHRVWTSDNIDALSRVAMQRGFLQFFPPEIMGAHVGAATAHTTGRSQNLAFRAAVALPGHFGVELDIRQLGSPEHAELRDWIALYKRLRHRLHHGAVWRGSVDDGLVWQAHGTADADSLLLLVYRITPTSHRYTPPLRLPMLQSTARYRVTELALPAHSEPAHLQSTSLTFEKMKTGGVVFDGSWLQQAGMPLPRLLAQNAWAVQLDRC